MRKAGKQNTNLFRSRRGHGLQHRTVVAGLFLAVSGVSNRVTADQGGVTAEAVDYYYHPDGTLYSHIICIAEADNFRNGLINAPNTIFHAGHRYTGPGVWDTDFVDPDRTGHSWDNDTSNFDDAGNGVA